MFKISVVWDINDHAYYRFLTILVRHRVLIPWSVKQNTTKPLRFL